MIWVICKQWIHSGAQVGENNDWPYLFIAPTHCWAATRFHMHPPTGHTQAAFTGLADLFHHSSKQLFAWLGGQLDYRRSPAGAWKPDSNQCGFASAFPTLA
ncbi:hypothetical protein O181_061347 [Austropuccinia psidii MF-1]|uniref:Uncharacterized protein n=1 Tax=Austropuccinia psidii MF-1 TaxID=1389203 RepID=A0A9Q3EKG8_9BASI|nr:hypothetical protein [Austropuccinia psidii MF-1]